MTDLVRVYGSGNTFDGELTKGRLEAEGIPVMMKGEGEGPYRAGPVDLYVPADREADARAVLDAIERGAYAVDEDDLEQDPGPPVDAGASD
jgi:Putative prokaryotic signal transducing protein